MATIITSMSFIESGERNVYREVIIRRADGSVRSYDINSFRRILDTNRIANFLTTSHCNWACIQDGRKVELMRRLFI